MRIDVLTLFPAMFGQVLSASILGRAEERGFASYHVHNIRDWAHRKHGKVDDRQLSVNVPRADYWLSVGAQPSRTVASLLRRVGGDPKPGKTLSSGSDQQSATAVADG